jgi:putative oxidoreductase
MTDAHDHPRPGWLFAGSAPNAVILIRLVVGGIFLSEGIQKFLFPDRLGPGRFAEETPLPVPEFFAYLSATFEIACGALLLLGLFTRLAAIPMIINMLGAEIFTKFPILAQDGVWAYLHEARNELGQLFGSLFLLAVGAGAWSLDARLARRHALAAGLSHSGAPRS